MPSKLIYILCIFTSQCFIALGQNIRREEICIKPIFDKTTLQLDKSYYHSGIKDSISISAFKFYISSIELIQNEKVIWKEENSFHLIDTDNETSLSIPLHIPSDLQYNKIKFNIGIDSVTNTSGAMGGDLDPTKGMYWAWQSGYINFKLEGKSTKQEFQFHLGGYQTPFNSLKTISLNLSPNSEKEIYIDIKKLITEIDLTKQHHIMSPSEISVLLSQKLAEAFSTY